MVLFDFKSDKHFVASSDKITIHVYELTNLTIHPSRIRKTHWREVASITPAPDHQEESYNGLMFFDGHGKIEGQEALTKLAQHLTRLRLIVSPQGQSFQDVAELGEHKEFGIHYLRLNDLFNWPDHGVNMASVTTWPRIVLKYTITKREKRPMMNEGVSKEKYEELKKMVSQKDKALEKLKEEMKEQDREIQTLKEKKDDELQMLKRRKDKEIQMLEEEKENASEQQEAELQELEKKKNEELRDLMKRKDDELQNLETMMNDEEIQMLRDATEQHEAELQELEKEKDEELKKHLKKKDAELQMLKKRKDKEVQALEEERKDAYEQHEAELRGLKKKNDEELRELMRKKDDEVQVMEKRKDDELKEKNEELKTMEREKDEGEKLSKGKDEELKTLRDEVENLRNNANKGDEAGAVREGKILVDSDEWQKLKKDEKELKLELTKKDEEIKRRLEKEKEDKEALQKSMNEKDAESRKMKKEKEEMIQAHAAETRNLRVQVSQLHDQEHRRKQPWQWTSATRFVLNVHHRRPVPPGTWSDAVPSHCYNYDPYATTGALPFPRINWAMVDEDPKDWPLPSKIGISCQPGQFDKNNWWFIKTFHPDGLLTMVAYYDGTYPSLNDPGHYTIQLPFPRNSKFSTAIPFSLLLVNGTYKLAFIYRD
ncbi:unnamed protein product [Linum tenue]|uniref:Uncharacterized protein n=1 Tax=Linum tenue TaxID=586396 RepID=A0AAV0L4L5_9ROSI|nr:unnamed protein product [Linum tenue]